MLPVTNLGSFKGTLHNLFARDNPKKAPKQELRMKCMRPGDSFTDTFDGDGAQSRLVGLLFINPRCELAKREIIPLLEQYHHSAGRFTHFFFPGYGTGWPPGRPRDQRSVGIEIDGSQWKFSPTAFEEFRRDVEAQTKWRFSGETDLILTTATFAAATKTVELDFKEAITCSLEQLLRDEGAPSVPAFFQKIFRFAEENSNSSAYNLSDSHLIATSKASLVSWVLSSLKMEAYFKKNKHLAIRNISK